jgi:hypothetical protein
MAAAKLTALEKRLRDAALSYPEAVEELVKALPGPP